MCTIRGTEAIEWQSRRRSVVRRVGWGGRKTEDGGRETNELAVMHTNFFLDSSPLTTHIKVSQSQTARLRPKADLKQLDSAQIETDLQLTIQSFLSGQWCR